MTILTPISDLAKGLRQGNRKALAKAITLIESHRSDHRSQALELLDILLPVGEQSLRIGISGPPGVGKSTFIESFGLEAVGRGRRVAVLAVDPSSLCSGGSILGDKTRMDNLAHSSNAFIRPSPSGLTLGGVARYTFEAMLCCEAAGYDTILIETVGVGQSEVAVGHITDLFLLLIAPGGGDSLQGMKKGIMEMADMILVNKADGNLLAAARHTASEYANALGLIAGKPATKGGVDIVSAAENKGIAEAFDRISTWVNKQRDSKRLSKRRRHQLVSAMWAEVQESVMVMLRGDSGHQALAQKLQDDVCQGKILPSRAAQDILAMAKITP